MLTVEVWLDSALDGRRSLVAQGVIINDATGTTREGNYDVQFVEYPRRIIPAKVRLGRVVGWNRDQSVLPLVAEAITAAIGRGEKQGPESKSQLKRLDIQRSVK